MEPAEGGDEPSYSRGTPTGLSTFGDGHEVAEEAEPAHLLAEVVGTTRGQALSRAS